MNKRSAYQHFLLVKTKYSIFLEKGAVIPQLYVKVTNKCKKVGILIILIYFPPNFYEKTFNEKVGIFFLTMCRKFFILHKPLD
jgi:hypothetical protein